MKPISEIKRTAAEQALVDAFHATAVNSGRIDNDYLLRKRELWSRFKLLPAFEQGRAEVRLAAVLGLHEMEEHPGVSKMLARSVISYRYKVSPGTISRWRSKTYGLNTEDWLPALAKGDLGYYW